MSLIAKVSLLYKSLLEMGKAKSASANKLLLEVQKNSLVIYCSLDYGTNRHKYADFEFILLTGT